MRTLYHEFVEYILNNHTGSLRYPCDMPVDQGALNCFFKKQATLLPAEYNWKVFWPHREDVFIMHMQGPKRSDYELWLNGNSPTHKFFDQIFNLCDRQVKNCENNLLSYDFWLRELTARGEAQCGPKQTQPKKKE